MVNLGDKVKDRITGFEGIAISRHSYINGCDRISVQPAIDKDGKLPETETFDEPDAVSLGNKDVGGPEKYIPKPKR